MKMILLCLLFILCVILPSLFRLLEGMEYSTELLDRGPHYTTTPQERGLLSDIDVSLNRVSTL